MKHLLVLLILLLVQIFSVCSQEYLPQIDYLTTSKGLSQNSVNTILTDHTGFMWFGTKDGLNFYDGQSFTIYRNEPNDTNSLSNNAINCLLQDVNNDIWIGTEYGLNRFDYASGNIRRYLSDGKTVKAPSSNFIKALFMDDDKNIWIGTSGGGLNLYNQNGTFSSFPLKIKEVKNPSNDILCIKPSILFGRNFMWVGTENGLYLFSKSEKKYIGLPELFKNTNYQGQVTRFEAVMDILEDSTGMLWVATWSNSAIKCNLNTGEFTSIFKEKYPFLLHEPVSSFSLSPPNTLWIGTKENGLFTLNTSNGDLTEISKTLENSNPLNRILKLHADRQNQMWVGTYLGGVAKLNLNETKFHHFSLPDRFKSDSYIIPNALYQSKNSIWVGTRNNGLIRINAQFKESGRFLINDLNISKPILAITSLEINNKEYIFAGTDGNGLYKLDSETGEYTQHTHEKKNTEKINNNYVYSLAHDKNGIVWYGTWGGSNFGGLGAYIPVKDKFYSFTYNKNMPLQNILPNNNIILALHLDKNGVLWAGTKGGGLNKIVYTYTESTGELTLQTKYFTGKQSGSIIQSNDIYSILEDKNGILWLGTGGGMTLFNPYNEKFTSLSISDGMPNNIIYGIVQDNSGNIWYSNTKGLAKFDPETKVLQNFDEKDGLLGDNMNLGACLKTNEGLVMFGGIKGVNYFYPESILYNYHIPTVAITKLFFDNTRILPGKEYDGRKILDSPIYLSSEIKFPSKTKNIRFDFAVLDYVAPEKNIIQYQLLGFDDKWYTLQNGQNSINFTSLKHGTYTLKVIGSNNDGIFNKKGIELKIIVTPPFYLTWWFRLGVILCFLFIVLKTIWGRFKKMEVEKDQIEQQAEEIILKERNHLRTLVDNIPDFIYIKDRESRFLLSNQSLCFNMRVTSEAELIGKTDFDFYPYELANKFYTDEQKILKTGIPFINTKEFGINEFGQTLHILTTKIPVRNASGKITGLIGIGRNITNEKLVEDELHQKSIKIEDERKLLRTLIDNLPDRIYVKDAQSRIIICNIMQAKVTGGLTVDKLIGKTDHDFYEKSLADKFYKDEQAIIKSGKPLINIEEIGLDTKGNKRHILTTKIPLKNQNGKVTGLVGIGRDITELKEIQERLQKQTIDLQEVNVLLEERQEEIQQQSEELSAQTENLRDINTELHKLNNTKDKFFSIIAHDLKNPFNAIISLSDFLIKDFGSMPDPEKLELVKLINISSENAYSLLENLLQWARAQTDRIKFNPQNLILAPLIDDNFLFHRINSERKNLKMTNNLDESIEVYADKNMLNLIIRNLLSNAIKFTDINGKIKVDHREKGNFIEISVSDNGVGIEPDNVERLFRIDEHFSTSGTTGEAGTGLGLIVCREFIRKHGGDIRVESKMGKGSTFYFTIPKINARIV